MSENNIKISWGKSLNEKIKLFFGREYFRSRIILWLLFLSIFANIIDWLALAIYLHPAGSEIILHYNVYFGVDSVGTVRGAYVLPLVGLIILLANITLSFYFYAQKERIASYVLLITALMAELSLLISVISVIIINY
ncbi:MAG: hypothetical protein NTY33_04780 [Candidatus Moranbacteria bacterium]|nr:hypothetical protein [Candidatus Moranbacteria bacterium]